MIYVEKVHYENVGPIKDICISFSFEENGNPMPIIFVGENGSGKSTILSNIVDAFYEMAGTAFNNAQQPADTAGHLYYKAISPIQIFTGQEYMYSYISFRGDHPCFYICKSGNITSSEVKQKIGDPGLGISWNNEKNYKKTSMNKQDAETEWDANVICYFGPDRYERPVWMGKKYFSDEQMQLTIRERVAGHLDKPIGVKSVTPENLGWLLDVIADSRPDAKLNEGITLLPNGEVVLSNVSIRDLAILGQARTNLQQIMSKIIGDEVYFALNYRNTSSSRFRIVRKKDNFVIAPTLNSLSTGQIALFNMFSTIVRYADYNSIMKSVQLSDIEGIVVIDEIELHLHTKLQKEVLPELLKLFPKVQFIITTHAPLFLLGMKEVFGEDHFEVYELPTGTKINTEKFAEFQRAYQYIKETETYQKEAEAALKSIQSDGKAVIVTEGSTDWKHLKAAFENLKACGNHRDLFDNLDFEFFEYESAESSEEAANKLKMGTSVLRELCKNMAMLPQPVKYIFIADRDDNETNNKLSVPDNRFKSWGNNVYSFILPIPQHRTATPNICIEHYYTDDEIKTEWQDPESGNNYRLFMGNEFDERGIAQGIDRVCENKKKCGRSSIAIIDGSSGEKVTSISNNNGTNYALPKSRFAKMIQEKQAPFDSFSFDSFISIFQVIKEIISLE